MPPDPVALVMFLAVLCVAAAGYVTGRVAGRRGIAALNRTQHYRCGCTHDLALHDPKTKKCHGQIHRHHYNKNGTRNGYEWADCGCRQYTGQAPPEQIGWSTLTLPPATRDTPEGKQ